LLLKRAYEQLCVCWDSYEDEGGGYLVEGRSQEHDDVKNEITQTLSIKQKYFLTRKRHT
jgi:hypothetical protein